jgi:hypothetical protein
VSTSADGPKTCRIHAGAYEAIYSGMPPFDLGQTGSQLVVTEANDADRQRPG